MLGHEVSFAYCRTQEGDRLCGRILDCWWETFDVCGFLRDNLPAEQFGKLADPAPRPPKVASLAELIAQARARVEAEKKHGGTP
jgi:hypothetical protein